MSKKRNIKVGIIGLGYAKQVIIPALQELNGFEIVGLANSKNEYRIVEINNYRFRKVPALELISSNETELIVIATPIKFHWLYITEALNNLKKVFCEKPLGNSSDLNNIFELKNYEKLETIYVGYQFRYDFMVEQIKQIVEKHNSNSLMSIDVKWNTSGGNRFISQNVIPPNLWLDFGSHVIDYLYFIGKSCKWGDLKLSKITGPCSIKHKQYPKLCNSIFLEGKNVKINISICRISEKTPSHSISVQLDKSKLTVGQKFPFNFGNYFSSELGITPSPQENIHSRDIRINDEMKQFAEIRNELLGLKSSEKLAKFNDAVRVHGIINEIF